MSVDDLELTGALPVPATQLKDFPGGHSGCGPQRTRAVGEQDTPAAKGYAPPIVAPPQGPQTGRGQGPVDTQSSRAPATNSPDGQRPGDHQPPAAVEGPSSPQATADSTTRADPPVGAQFPIAPAEPAPWAPNLDRDLAAAADALNDIEQVRIGCENRLRQFTRPLGEVDKDGNYRGFGWDLRSPAVHAQALLLAAMRCDSKLVRTILGDERTPKTKGCCLEHDAERNLTRALRPHPLGPWVRSKDQKGIGEKQGARLVAVIGDPYIRPAMLRSDDTREPARVRTKAELRAYCGYGEDKTRPGRIQRRRKGQHANWSAAAKMRAHLVAEKCMVSGFDKSGGCVRDEGDDFATHTPDCGCSRYRLLYDAGRVKYADAVHDEECPQCGPAGHPAPAGSPLSLGHRKNRALRLVAKAILEDLWAEAERIHHETPASGYTRLDPHIADAAGGD